MALGASTFSDFGGAISDLYAASADQTKAAGLRIEGQEYTLASTLATQNEQYTEQSTELQQYQESRKIEQTLGAQQAEVAASGFGASGTADDLLRDSANQGALAKATLAQQGLITEAGYTEQAQSYTLMSQAADMAASAADKAAQGSDIGAIVKGVAGVATLIPGGGALAGLGGLFGQSGGSS